MELEEGKIGQVVYFEDAWEGREAGRITSVETADDGKPYWKLDCIDFIGTAMRHPEDCYPSKIQYNRAIKAKHNAIIQTYKNNIKDVNDLVNFALNNNISNCENCDYEAREAYIQRAKELGLDVDNK